MAPQTSEAKSQTDIADQLSLTQLLARILNQLSVSAWLPAAAVVFIALLYGELRMPGNQGSPLMALSKISSMGWGSLVLAIGAVVLGTMLTQAFEFEAIRLLEGYWGPGWFGSHLADIGCAFHQSRRVRMRRNQSRLQTKAFCLAREEMRKQDDLRPIANILDAELHGEDPPAGTTEEQVREARALGWYSDARPRYVRRLLEYSRRLSEEYPEDSYRVMPTRLGNVLRAYERRAFPSPDGSLEGAVERLFHLLPGHLQVDYDQAESRLHLYCTMSIVFVFSAIAAFPAIGLTAWRTAAAALFISAVLAVVSYRAAIASAKGYGVVLETIGETSKTMAAPSSSPA